MQVEGNHRRQQAGARQRAHRVVRGAEAAVAACVIAAGIIAGLHLAAGHSPPTRAPAPLRVVSVSPAGGAVGVAQSAVIAVRFSAPLAARSPMPSISPAISGRWQRAGAELRFVPSLPALPLTTETLSIPGGRHGMLGAGGGRLASAARRSWQARDGSVLRLQQILARLGYLPLTWTRTGARPASTSPGGTGLNELYQPPTGQFTWRYDGTPAALRAAWKPGVDNHMTTGAMVAFEREDGLPAYTSIRAQLWPVLLSADAAGKANPEGYTFALVSQAQPETLTLWHDGRDVFTSAANTGTAQTPTPAGTFFVYLRFASTTMQGTNPNGSYYIDHGVRWVSYFDGGDAIHGFIRAAYGFPQSLGCVELPVASAARAWPWIHYGTVVTVLPPAAS